MKSSTLLPLALALSVSLLATACNKKEAEVTPPAEPAVATEPAATEPAPMEPAPTEPAPPTPAPAAPAVDSGLTFAAMDKNADGGITTDELANTEMLYEHFSAADADSDGKLTSAEVDAHRAAMAAAPPAS